MTDRWNLRLVARCAGAHLRARSHSQPAGAGQDSHAEGEGTSLEDRVRGPAKVRNCFQPSGCGASTLHVHMPSALLNRTAERLRLLSRQHQLVDDAAALIPLSRS